MPGVTVTVTSDALQGSRIAVTDSNGNYELLGLPNGEYRISFSLDGFSTAESTTVVPLGVTADASVTMRIGEVNFAVQVTAYVPTPLTSTEISQNITNDEVDSLPVGRTPFRIAELAPGLTANTPNNGQVAINGAFAYDNVYLLDGVDINDNLFGDADSLFIEGAIEEVQVLTSGISAEYGRFSGGVINVVTKSGANVFSGSFRGNFYKPGWTGRTPFEKANDNERTGDIADNATYETTVGGPILKDRLWFFYANRRQRRSADETLPVSGISYVNKQENDRNQIKFTGTIAPGHTLEGSYLRNSTESASPTFPFSLDPATLINPKLPNDLVVATYRGAVNSRLFVEAQVSRKEFAIRDVGGTSTTITDSPFITLTQGLGQYNAPFFDASDNEDRNNRQFTGRATYLLPTRAGTHSIKSGFEHFRSTHTGGNSQSATGFYYITPYAENADGTPQLDGNGRFIPVFGAPAPFTLQLTTLPVLNARIDIDTVSVYVNDNWTVNDNISLNLGIRGEKVSSDATGRVSGLDAGAVVPRLGVAIDPLGDGRYTFQATYSHYAGKYSESQFAANTNVGTPDELTAVYVGPPGQGVDFAPGFDPANYFTVAGDFPTQNVFFDDNLKSPRTKEVTVSAGGAIGDRGYAKITYVNRRAGDFVEDFVTLDGGSTTVTGSDGAEFGTFSNINFRNTDALERTYDGLEIQGRYQAASNFLIDGSYTVQLRNEGNFEGESGNMPAVSSAAFDYPEITPADRYFPTGRLDDFQRHKIRLWGIYDLDLGTAGHVDVSGIWRYDSGLAYSISTDLLPTPEQEATLAALGYVDGPAERTVYFGGRGTETFDGYGLLDLSVNYAIPVWRSLSPWIKFDLFNAFNNSKQIRSNIAVTPDPNSPVDAVGIPTGYVEGPLFGEATSVDHFPQYIANLDGLRTFLMSLGFRF